MTLAVTVQPSIHEALTVTVHSAATRHPRRDAKLWPNPAAAPAMRPVTARAPTDVADPVTAAARALPAPMPMVLPATQCQLTEGRKASHWAAPMRVPAIAPASGRQWASGRAHQQERRPAAQGETGK
jgi:hypothetical protein